MTPIQTPTIINAHTVLLRMRELPFWIGLVPMPLAALVVGNLDRLAGAPYHFGWFFLAWAALTLAWIWAYERIIRPRIVPTFYEAIGEAVFDPGWRVRLSGWDWILEGSYRDRRCWLYISLPILSDPQQRARGFPLYLQHVCIVLDYPFTRSGRPSAEMVTEKMTGAPWTVIRYSRLFPPYDVVAIHRPAWWRSLVWGRRGSMSRTKGLDLRFWIAQLPKPADWARAFDCVIQLARNIEEDVPNSQNADGLR